MKPNFLNRLHLLGVAAALPFISSASAADFYWNPVPLDGTWNTATLNWATTPGGTPDSAWSNGATSNPFFDREGAYTVNSSGAKTAGTLNVLAGTVTLTGDAIASGSINIASGATLTAAYNTIAKTGTTAAAATTPVTLNGTLDLSLGGAGASRFLRLSGTGTLIGAIRHSGTSIFAGDFKDVTLPAPAKASIVWNGGAGGNLTLSGDNSGMTGAILMSVPNSVLSLNSANALGQSATLRLESGGNSVLVDLAFGDLTRVWADGLAGGIDPGTLNLTGTNAGLPTASSHSSPRSAP